MAEMMAFFAAKLGSFMTWLGTLVVVNGVTLLGLFGAFFVLFLVINNLLYRAK